MPKARKPKEMEITLKEIKNNNYRNKSKHKNYGWDNREKIRPQWP